MAKPDLREVALSAAIERADKVEAIMQGAVVSAREALPDLAGFALVAWDMRGATHTVYASDVGPVDRCLVPMFAHGALNRHVAVAIASEAEPTALSPDPS
jgi:hypothetical protein